MKQMKNKEFKELLIKQVKVLDKKFHNTPDLELQIKITQTILESYLYLQEPLSFFQKKTNFFRTRGV